MHKHNGSIIRIKSQMKGSYYHTKESVEEYINMAKDVNSEELILKLNEFLKPGLKVLELGSGPGTDLLLLRKNYKAIGSDFSEEFVARLKVKFPNDDILHLDAISISTEKSFDGIYSNKVLQHLTDQEIGQSVQRQVQILNANGIICHSFWRGDGEEVFKGMFVNYQSEYSLRALFQEDFEILQLERYKEFDEDDSLVLIARKK